MKATEIQLLEFLKKSPQLEIPIYQRTYSWEKPECLQLWEDIMRVGNRGAISSHFVGSIVYIQDGIFRVADPSPVLVIDGQQRITTVSLVVEALARQLGDDEPVDGFSASKLRNRYLQDPEESDDRRYKLLLTQTDKQTLLAIIDNEEFPDNHSIRLKENFGFFEKKVKELGDDLKPLCMGLKKLVAVDISLDRGHDNPQLIFESMNSTGQASSAKPT